MEEIDKKKSGFFGGEGGRKFNFSRQRKTFTGTRKSKQGVTATAVLKTHGVHQVSRTEVPRYKARQCVRFLGLYTFQCCCEKLNMHCHCVYLRKTIFYVFVQSKNIFKCFVHSQKKLDVFVHSQKNIFKCICSQSKKYF
jgi:hypothetical protein